MKTINRTQSLLSGVLKITYNLIYHIVMYSVSLFIFNFV